MSRTDAMKAIIGQWRVRQGFGSEVDPMMAAEWARELKDPGEVILAAMCAVSKARKERGDINSPSLDEVKAEIQAAKFRPIGSVACGKCTGGLRLIVAVVDTDQGLRSISCLFGCPCSHPRKANGYAIDNPVAAMLDKAEGSRILGTWVQQGTKDVVPARFQTPYAAAYERGWIERDWPPPEPACTKPWFVPPAVAVREAARWPT